MWQVFSFNTAVVLLHIDIAVSLHILLQYVHK